MKCIGQGPGGTCGLERVFNAGQMARPTVGTGHAGMPLECESIELNARDNHVYHGEGALYADYEDMTNDVKPIYKGEWLSQGSSGLQQG